MKISFCSRIIFILVLSAALAIPAMAVESHQVMAGPYTILTDAQGHQTIRMDTPGYGILSSPGDPQLPEMILEYRAPPDATDVRMEVEVLESELFQGPYNLIPNPPIGVQPGVSYPYPLSDPNYRFYGFGKSIVNGQNMLVYANDSYYPADSFHFRQKENGHVC